MAENKISLFPEFPPVSATEWESLIHSDLKGKDYEKALVWHTYEGFSVKPYYRQEDLQELDYLGSNPAEFPFTRGTNPSNDWFIRQDIFAENLEEANKKALSILNRGVDSLGFYFDCCKKITAADLAVLLNGISPEAAEINFTCPCGNCNCIEEFIEFASTGKWDKNKIIASSTADPIGNFMLKGIFEEGSEENAFLRLKSQVEKSQSIPDFRIIGINGKFFGNSGSTIVQELAFSLTIGAEYMTRLIEQGLSADTVANKIKFNFSISSNYFLEIAKLRAARLLWAKIVEAFNPENKECAEMVIHCETGTFNKTIYDPHVNLLRTQTEAMSAALGGVHSLTVLPFDYVYSQPADFSERVARNQQLLLKEEAYFSKVADPAAGSYYIEKLTASVMEEAWKLLLTIEEMGGFLSAFRQGFVQSQIREIAGLKSKNLASRRDHLLGTNQFPNFNESIKWDLDSPFFQPVDFTEQGAEVETLKPFRLAQPFEALRYKTDKYSLEHKRPTVFMLTFGNMAMRKARAQFICNFFAVAGFKVIDNNGFESAGEGVNAARKANADIIAVCSSDEEYIELVPQVAGLLGNEILVVAGNPECRKALEEKGIRNYIHIKSNILEDLKIYQEMLGIV